MYCSTHRKRYAPQTNKGAQPQTTRSSTLVHDDQKVSVTEERAVIAVDPHFERAFLNNLCAVKRMVDPLVAHLRQPSDADSAVHRISQSTGR